MKISRSNLLLKLVFVLLISSIESCKTESETIIEPSFTVTDIDGNIYNTIAIGNQVWLTSNLKTTRYRNGDSIPNVVSNTEWATTLNGAYCKYDHSVQNGNTYGYFYNLFAVKDSRGIAPVGYHIPSQAEMETLVKFLGSGAGGKMKEAGLIHWASPNTGATNIAFLSILPGGIRNENGTFIMRDSIAGIWTSTSTPGSGAEPELHGTYNQLSYNSDSIITNSYARGYSGFSVRCLKD